MKTSIMKINGILGVGLMLCVGLSFQSCKSDKDSPGFEFMPNMYRSPSVETYGENHTTGGADSMAARTPVKGTIPRGFQPYNIPNTPEGYELSASLVNPIPYSPEVMEEGKLIYDKFCMHCHGETGLADGKVVTNGGFPPPPAFNAALKDLPEGKMFHSITYGKNLMGSHASQVNTEDRWKIIHYIRSLQNPEYGKAPVAAADTTKTIEVAQNEVK